MVPVVGVEPTRYRYHGILSPARLPIPSHRRKYLFIILEFCKKNNIFFRRKIAEFFVPASEDTVVQEKEFAVFRHENCNKKNA